MTDREELGAVVELRCVCGVRRQATEKKREREISRDSLKNLGGKTVKDRHTTPCGLLAVMLHRKGLDMYEQYLRQICRNQNPTTTALTKKTCRQTQKMCIGRRQKHPDLASGSAKVCNMTSPPAIDKRKTTHLQGRAIEKTKE